MIKAFFCLAVKKRCNHSGNFTFLVYTQAMVYGTYHVEGSNGS